MILKSAFIITLQRIFEVIFNIIIFRNSLNFVNNTTGLSGIYSFCITIFITNKARHFVLKLYVSLKKKYFPKHVILFDWKQLNGYDLNKIFFPNSSNQEIESIQDNFIKFKKEIGNHLFEFIFKSASHSYLIIVLTIIFSDYLKNNYGINIYTSFVICISFSFVISFVASLNYTKILLKEWNELLNDLEKTNSNRRFILYVYGKAHTNDTEIIESSEDDSMTTHRQRRDSKKQEFDEKVKFKEGNLKLENQFIVGIVSNEIDKEENVIIKLMLLNPKFAENLIVILESSLMRFIIPQILSKSNSPLVNSLPDTVFGSQTVKDCIVYVTDYYNVASRLSNYLKSKSFKIHDKWTEYNMFLFMKFKVYEFKRSFSNLIHYPTPIAPNDTLKNE
jgi:hypothetical protein